jgi:cytoskeletal protein CcmA (bactofilin family)
MKSIQRILTVFMLIALFSMTFATPALAFDGRSGDVVVIEADEVVNDDLYVGADQFTLEGTVKGDLIVFGNFITINGTVEGDLIAAGNTVLIEGTVTDDVRIAGAALQLGDTAVIGGDLIAAGASLEAKQGSSVENDVVFAGAQGLLAGSIGDDLQLASGALELRGEIGGDVQAEVGEMNEAGPPPSMYISNTNVPIPTVNPGLKIAEGAKIGGDFTYTQSKDIEIPAGAVAGKVTRNEPVVDQRAVPAPPTPAEAAANWTFDLIRHIVTLAIFGFLLAWLLPLFMKGLMDELQAQPIPSFGWGIVAYAAFFFALFLIVVVTIILGVVFGMLTLGGVTGTIIWVSLVLLFAMVVGFVLFTGFGSQILVAWLGGRWILGRFNPALAEHKVWPLLLGVVIVGLLVNLPVVGWLIGFIIMFFGLGALWLWVRERTAKPAAVAVQ